MQNQSDDLRLDKPYSLWFLNRKKVGFTPKTVIRLSWCKQFAEAILQVPKNELSKQKVFETILELWDGGCYEAPNRTALIAGMNKVSAEVFGDSGFWRTLANHQ